MAQENLHAIIHTGRRVCTACMYACKATRVKDGLHGKDDDDDVGSLDIQPTGLYSMALPK